MMLDLDFIEEKRNWADVFETLTQKDIAEIKRTNYDSDHFPDGVTEEKMVEDVANYFLDFGGDDAPDVADGKYTYTKANFLWACNL